MKNNFPIQLVLDDIPQGSKEWEDDLLRDMSDDDEAMSTDSQQTRDMLDEPDVPDQLGEPMKQVGLNLMFDKGFREKDPEVKKRLVKEAYENLRASIQDITDLETSEDNEPYLIKHAEFEGIDDLEDVEESRPR